jgi:acetyl-CoA C-acetyltransferase
MASNGIKDQVAIVGMGCTPFGEHWDRDAADMLIDAASEAYASAGVDPDDVDAYWLGTFASGISGMVFSEALKTPYKPVTRLENMCATGSEAIRNAAYAVASGAYDLVMAVGVEKLKDGGYSGLVIPGPDGDGTESSMTAPAMFSLLAPAYCEKYGVDEGDLKDVLSRIAWKNHVAGAKNPKAQFRKEVPLDKICKSPRVAGMFGVFDCSGVSDGSAAAILCRAEDAYKYTDKPIFLKALSIAAGPNEGFISDEYDFTTFQEVVVSAQDAYKQAGITNPREEISMAEVHDCFTATELVLMEDMGFSERGEGWKDVMEGRFDGDGAQPINPDGGLKSFGHPIGASGLRMMYEMWLQLRGEAGERQIKDPKLGLTHNLGGQPGRCVSFISIVGRELG